METKTGQYNTADSTPQVSVRAGDADNDRVCIHWPKREMADKSDGRTKRAMAVPWLHG